MNEELQKEINEKAAYGTGTSVGFTSDGMVFIVHDTEGPEGRPMQTIHLLPPDEAIRMATTLVETAKEARKAKEVLNNGRPDSNRTN